ncbi:unnamed protein product [Penicillium glandicola]
MAPLKKGKKPAEAAPNSKVKKTRAPRAIKKRKRTVFTEEEVFLYRAIKYGNPKFDHQAIGNAIGKSKDAARMQMSRLLDDIREFLRERGDLDEEARPEHEETSFHQEDAENASQDQKNDSDYDQTSIEASNPEEV